MLHGVHRLCGPHGSLMKKQINSQRPELRLRLSSKTSDERLRVARARLKKVREPAKSIVYCNTRKSAIDLRCYVDASYNQATDSSIKFNVRGSISGLMGHNDTFSKTWSKITTRLCTMGTSSKEFSKDSVKFESPTCGRATVKALLSLVPDKKWRIGTFDASLAFFQGDSLQREVYIKDPEGSSFWVLKAALYGLHEGARN